MKDNSDTLANQLHNKKEVSVFKWLTGSLCISLERIIGDFKTETILIWKGGLVSHIGVVIRLENLFSSN